MAEARVLRLIEYSGTTVWVVDMINQRTVKGHKILPKGVIREAMIGETLELLGTTYYPTNHQVRDLLKEANVNPTAKPTIQCWIDNQREGVARGMLGRRLSPNQTDAHAKCWDAGYHQALNDLEAFVRQP